jgi:hypothetical protein
VGAQELSTLGGRPHGNSCKDYVIHYLSMHPKRCTLDEADRMS